MWSDNETDIDLLDSGHLVAVVNALVLNDTLLPTTIGVFGDWGSGKSSLIRMIEKSLSDNSNIMVLQFNGWLFEGYEDAKTALMGTILKEIEANKKLSGKAKEVFTRLVSRVNWMRMAAYAGKYALAYNVLGTSGVGLIAALDLPSMVTGLRKTYEGIDLPDLEENLRKFIKDPSDEDEDQLSIQEFHDDFAKLLDETDVKKLVIIIDDLDRCLPNTIIDTLEAIRLFLYTPRTVFIIAADERLVKYAVRQRFKDIQQGLPRIEGDYLEKLVQFPIRIPPLGRPEIETYIKLLFANRSDIKPEDFEKLRVEAINRKAEDLYQVTFDREKAEKVLGGKMPASLTEDLALADFLAPVLASGLSGNPRQTKRFLNMLMMRLEMAKSRDVPLKRRILAKLMLLEYIKPQSFRQLADWQANQNGVPNELRLLEQNVQLDGTSPAIKTDKAGTNEKANSNPVEKDTQELPQEVENWIKDEWLTSWLESDPSLTDVDLRSYFFFSRDRLGYLDTRSQRLSPNAQQILGLLLSGSDLHLENAIKRAEEVNDAEAEGILDSLGENARRQESLSASSGVLVALIRWAKKRSELLGVLITILARLSLGAIPPGLVPLAATAYKDSEHETAFGNLLQRWQSQEENPQLAEAANQHFGSLRE